jgi:hypothetical protein
MLVLTTYPKISSWTCADFALQQILVKRNSTFHAKAITQKYIQPLQKMSYTHKEGSKIGFAFLGFFWEFTYILQGTGLSWNKTKIKIITLGSLFHRNALGIQNHAPTVAGELVGGGAGLEGASKWGGRAIMLTVSRFAAVGWSKVSPAMAGGETAAMKPLRLELRRNVGDS